MNKKYKVSPEYIRLFLGLLHEGIDSKLEDLLGLNLVNRDSVKRLVKEYLYPEYQNFTISTQFRIKESLRFGLNFWTEERLRDQFPSTDAAFEIPQQMTAKELYKQIWDDMFNNEDITISDITKYQESNQIQQSVAQTKPPILTQGMCGTHEPLAQVHNQTNMVINTFLGNRSRGAKSKERYKKPCKPKNGKLPKSC